MNGKNSVHHSSFLVQRSQDLFAAAQHVVDQGPVPVVAIRTDMIEEGIVVGGEVAGVHEFLRDNDRVARIAELERPAHQADRLHGVER